MRLRHAIVVAAEPGENSGEEFAKRRAQPVAIRIGRRKREREREGAAPRVNLSAMWGLCNYNGIYRLFPLRINSALRVTSAVRKFFLSAVKIYRANDQCIHFLTCSNPHLVGGRAPPLHDRPDNRWLLVNWSTKNRAPLLRLIGSKFKLY